MPVFKTGALNRSAIPPHSQINDLAGVCCLPTELATILLPNAVTPSALPLDGSRRQPAPQHLPAFLASRGNTGPA